MATISVDGKEITAEEGAPLLQTCLDNDIYIPNLCYIKDKAPHASCRLCFVEIEGRPGGPVTSCTVNVTDGMVVKTDTPEVRQLQRYGLELLLSVHDVDCKNCHANKNCELQNLCKFLKVSLKPKHLEHYEKEPAVDDSHPYLTYFASRCVLCGRCVHTCCTENGQPLLSFARRGFDTVVSFHGMADGNGISAADWKACSDACPVGALYFKGE